MEKSLDARRIIINSFKELLKNKPVHKISITDIVNSSGFSRQTFYRHFSNIDSLIYTIHEEHVTLTYEINSKVGSYKIKFSLYLELMLENHEFYRKIISYHCNPSFVEMYIVRTKENFLKYFFTDYNELINQDKNLMLTLDFYIYGFSITVLNWIKSKDPYPVEDLVKIILDSIPESLREIVPASYFKS